MVLSLWKTAWKLFENLQIEIPYDPEVPLLSIYPKKIKPLSRRDI